MTVEEFIEEMDYSTLYINKLNTYDLTEDNLLRLIERFGGSILTYIKPFDLGSYITNRYSSYLYSEQLLLNWHYISDFGILEYNSALTATLLHKPELLWTHLHLMNNQTQGNVIQYVDKNKDLFFPQKPCSQNPNAKKDVATSS